MNVSVMNECRSEWVSHFFIGCIVFVLVSTPLVVFGAPQKLVLDTDEYHYEATFDPQRISEARLRELLPFSPYMDIGDGWKLDGVLVTIAGEESESLHDKSLLASPLELCLVGDPRYRPCGKGDLSDTNFSFNAQVNLESNTKVLAALDHLQIPTELRPIVEHYRDALAFSSLIQTRRLNYLRTADLRALSAPLGSIDPSKACSHELQELQSATTLEQRYKFSLYGWDNCVNGEWNRTSSGYPTNAWRNFLASYGIVEQFSEKSVD